MQQGPRQHVAAAATPRESFYDAGRSDSVSVYDVNTNVHSPGAFGERCNDRGRLELHAGKST